MPAAIATRPGLLSRIWRVVRIAWLRSDLAANERYYALITAGHREIASGEFDAWRRLIAQQRVQLALLEAGH